MKEKIKIDEYWGRFASLLPKGLLLNTREEKFNSMVISWGHLGIVWNEPTFITYVRESRFTKKQLDATGEFSISAPLDGVVPQIFKVCGSQSGRDVDKVAAAGLTLEEPTTIGVPGVKEYPLTLECRVLYSQPQVMARIPEEYRRAFYPGETDEHTAYIGKIVDAYIIR